MTEWSDSIGLRALEDAEPTSSATEKWSAKNFYNQMAETYHFTTDRYDEKIDAEWPVLQKIVSRSLGDDALRILDCACGVGTQLLGIARHGHHAVGSDFSEAALRRAGREAAARGINVRLEVADMRALPFDSGIFDAVVCADNSVAHLLTRDAMLRAITEMYRVLRPGGFVVITTRDYDAIRPQHVTGTHPFILPTDRGRVIAFQIWNWHADGERYDLEHFELMPDGHEEWRIQRFTTRLWAVSRTQLDDVLTTAGLTDPHWYECSESGYYQPIVTARRPSPENNRH